MTDFFQKMLYVLYIERLGRAIKLFFKIVEPLFLTNLGAVLRIDVLLKKKFSSKKGSFSALVKTFSFRTLGYMYSRSKKKQNTPIYFNANYRTEMKLVPIIMDYCLLQFDVLKFSLGIHLHGGSQPNFNFFNINPQIF